MGGIVTGIEGLVNGITSTVGLGNVFSTPSNSNNQSSNQNDALLQKQQEQLDEEERQNQLLIKQQQDQQLEIQKQVDAANADQQAEIQRKRKNALNVMQGGGLLEQNNNSLLG